MLFINSKIHGFLDYLVVVFLLVSPTLLELPQTTSLFTYVLAGVHLVLTLFTNFELGLFKIVPFELHGGIELLVSLLLFVGAFIFGAIDGDLSRNFYLIVGLIVFLTWKFTNYSRV